MRSTMRTASQLHVPGGEPTDVDDAPAPLFPSMCHDLVPFTHISYCSHFAKCRPVRLCTCIIEGQFILNNIMYIVL